MSSNEHEHFEQWTAEMDDETTVVTDTDPDEAIVPVDSAEAQNPPKPGLAEAIAGTRRPIVPDWARSRDSFRIEARRVADLGAHTAGFHGLRAPLYAAKLTARAPIGAFRWQRQISHWMWDLEGRPARAAAVERKEYEGYRKLVMARDRHVRWRAMVVAVVLIGSMIGVATLYALGGWPLWAALAGSIVACGINGGPKDKPLLDTAVVKTSLQPLTSDVVVRALFAANVTGINQVAAKEGKSAIKFVAPIHRDGPGWRAEVDLPWGVTSGEVAEKREKLASGLSRPLGCVWPEGKSEIHPGRLVLWVGDQDMANAKNPTWPLLHKGKVNLFEPFQIGTDPRGRPIMITLMFASMVVGAIPRMGKTFTVRLILVACALDPRVEIHAYDLKGSGDFSPLEPVSHRYRAGDREKDIAYLMADLQELHDDMQRRYEVIRNLPRDVCPENKVTDELASKKSLKLHPVVIAIDECQRGFEHSEHGAKMAEIVEDLVRRGPAVGMTVIAATQRVDKDSLPKGISSNAALRFCLKVTGQVENDMVLGTSAYKNGIRATMFGRKDRGIGYLTGEADDPQIVRGHFIDGPTAETIVVRARAEREAAGLLTGHAVGHVVEADATPQYDLLTDLVTVFPGKEKTEWNSVLVDRLIELRPDHYGHRWNALDNDTDKTSALTTALKEIKAEHIVGQVFRRGDNGGKSVNRRGINRDKLQEIITLRDGKSGSR